MDDPRTGREAINNLVSHYPECRTCKKILGGIEVQAEFTPDAASNNSGRTPLAQLAFVGALPT